MQEKPLILVTNDDGITAPGIRALIKIMNKIGDVVVVAPDKAQSGMGHAITIDNVLTCNSITIDDGPQLEYTCSGTPADCVKMAISEILNRKPDLCVSGINHGANASINVIYSGTMSAAIEAGIEGVPAIGFSLLDFKWDADFKVSEEYVENITLNALSEGIPEGVVLNVNIPNFKKEEIKGIKICRQANGYWKEDFDKRKSPFGKEYYWLSGEFVCKDRGQDTDIYALEKGYVSIVPVQFDMTAHHMIQKLNTWEL
ncbi:5'/3'-nucleotidase SurE [uncultured Polaribacter sp.]|uniref:5'/3'-nucleotidase SurE n=1 Tax=uncultured Polaribacter sp. TaxID=174711 RepID=UPI000A96CB00|nr:5'/3'-nucleotidase SurE [Polaribacter sp.]|tara:strand:+ start:231 stop:1001 length:771 start_codon:yes stop_codon:yes gene_type:complete